MTIHRDGPVVETKRQCRRFGFEPSFVLLLVFLVSYQLAFAQQSLVVGSANSSNQASSSLDKFAFIRAHHPEDLVPIPSSPWLVASSMSVNKGRGAPGGGFYLVNIEKRTAELIDKSKALQGSPAPGFTHCPGRPPEDLFAAHGMAIENRDGQLRLLVVNHGGRESVEVFAISMASEMPAFHWVGCVVFPSNLSLNAVAPLRDGGFVVTSMVDFNDPGRARKLEAGENTGAIYRWEPKHEPVPLPGTEACGDNGIEVGSDGSIYLNAWAGKAILRLREHDGRFVKETVPVDFMPDNLRWSPDGKLLVAGQRRSLEDFFKGCGASPCRIPWVAIELDPRSMKITTLVENDGAQFGDATTALRVGSELWLGSATEDRIAILPISGW
jgi:hypothetical protein